MKVSFLVMIISFACLSGCWMNSIGQEQNNQFSFAFITDIHLNNGKNTCFKSTGEVFRIAESNQVDFIITGGDNCTISMPKVQVDVAHQLYKGFAELINNAKVPVYPAFGNHDRFFSVDSTDELYNQGLFENYLQHKTYYSFNHKGWHFIILNSADTRHETNQWVIGKEQTEWLKNDLSNLPSTTPIVVVAHVPFISVYYPAVTGEYTSKDTFRNFKEVWNLFKNHDLRLVLQGHQHLFEEIKVLGTQFITGGSISTSLWGGRYCDNEESFMIIDIDESNNVSWRLIEHGWDFQ